MTTETVKINDLRLNDSNPRSITTEKFEKLVDSILCFPGMLMLRPIVVDRDTVVLGGNMRTKALAFIATLGYGQIVERLNGMSSFMAIHETKGETVFSFWKTWLRKPVAPVVRADDLTEEEKRQFIITDNASFGTWDYDLLANEWDEKLLMEWSIDLPWLDMTPPEEQEEKPKTETEVEKRCSEGDVWQLGKHRLTVGTPTSEADTLIARWEKLSGKQAQRITH